MLCLLPHSMSQKYLMKLMTHTGCVVPYFKKLSMSMPQLNRRQLRVITYHMNVELRRAINVKRMLKRKFTKCNSNMNWDKYSKQRNIVTKLLKKSLQQYMHKNATRLLMVVIFGKQFNHSSPIEVLTKMIIYLCLMMGKLLTTPMIYAEYSIIILRILLIA